MEAEIIALTACMRELIPIMDMVQSLAVAVGIPAGEVNMRVSVYEENLGCIGVGRDVATTIHTTYILSFVSILYL